MSSSDNPKPKPKPNDSFDKPHSARPSGTEGEKQRKQTWLQGMFSRLTKSADQINVYNNDFDNREASLTELAVSSQQVGSSSKPIPRVQSHPGFTQSTYNDDNEKPTPRVRRVSTNSMPTIYDDAEPLPTDHYATVPLKSKEPPRQRISNFSFTRMAASESRRSRSPSSPTENSPMDSCPEEEKDAMDTSELVNFLASGRGY